MHTFKVLAFMHAHGCTQQVAERYFRLRSECYPRAYCLSRCGIVA